MTDDHHIHRLRVAWEKYGPMNIVYVMTDLRDIKYVLDRLDKLTRAIEDFTPSSESDAEWKDEALSD